MNRILVIGSGGAGKSTLSVRLGAITGLPVIHLDALNWQSGWVETTRDKWSATVRQLISGQRWIVDGNYRGTLDLRLKAADAVIYLDYSALLCLYRVLRRFIRYRNRRRNDMAEGCPERVDPAFLWWIITFRSKYSRAFRRKLRALPCHKSVFLFRHPRDTEGFLRDLDTKGT
jgi:adenylate kinase family enzyme